MYTGQEDSHLLRFFSDLFFFFRHLAIEPSRDDRERVRQIKKPNCLKKFEITWNHKGYRNARPLVRILTPNHQLEDNSLSPRPSIRYCKSCLNWTQGIGWLGGYLEDITRNIVIIFEWNMCCCCFIAQPKDAQIGHSFPLKIHLKNLKCKGTPCQIFFCQKVSFF